MGEHGCGSKLRITPSGGGGMGSYQLVSEVVVLIRVEWISERQSNHLWVRSHCICLRSFRSLWPKHPGGSDGSETPRRFLGDMLDHWARGSLHLLREPSSGQQTECCYSEKS